MCLCLPSVVLQDCAADVRETNAFPFANACIADFSLTLRYALGTDGSDVRHDCYVVVEAAILEQLGVRRLVEIGHMIMSLLGYGTSRSRGSGSMLASQRSQFSGAMITGIRSWIWDTSSLAVVVMMQNVRVQSSVPGTFQFSQMAARANGSPDLMAMA